MVKNPFDFLPVSETFDFEELNLAQLNRPPVTQFLQLLL